MMWVRRAQPMRAAPRKVPLRRMGAPPFRQPSFAYILSLSNRPSLTFGVCPLPYRSLHMAGVPGGGDGESSVITKTRTRTERPPLYKVMLLNDDYTPMEFVVHVLERFFGLTHAQAFEIMLTVHKKGLAVVGVFSFEVAETKVAQVMDFARRHQHPLQCTMEKE